ncbi:MAG TPA: benzoyl-CoA 2,3-epoxidase subunit BoxB [Stellaceae bacterium]|nr:benzoyl-CoA 2,3-epoxidase subunit BoxB [Stellaceae bacterium]
MAIDYQSRIPNNVDLASNATLQRALEHWQPRFLDWWREMGPTDFLASDVYLRTATSVDAKGWASWGMVKMPDYRWGIFLGDAEPERRIGFGDRMGDPVWQQVPGEHRTVLRRLIVTQGDTEPASVEQQRLLGHSAPSLYDLRSLFQVNVEEGRHLWAMVYLLHAYFGRDGREEAEELLGRHSGDADRPRILTTFNEPIQDWLSFFMFTYFTDRDGKYQLLSLAESGFDPLSRTCRFMLMEEAHHMMVGVNGVARIVRRTLDAMKELKTDEPDKLRAAGVIDLPTIQRYLNFWFSSSLDLFGAEVSTNAAAYFANGIKGRPDEGQYDDHVCAEGALAVETPGGIEQVPLRNAMNEVMRGSYVDECDAGVQRWARMVKDAGFSFALKLPSAHFNRGMGVWGGVPVDPAGRIIDRAEWDRGRDEWLPSAADRAFVQSLMKPVIAPGQMASWIAAPERGINKQPLEYDYVRLA